jgi:Tfp pilus assembly protein PilN
MPTSTMNPTATVRTTTRIHALPRVNLLPSDISEARQFRRTQALLGLAVVGAVGVVGGLWLFSASQVSDAQDTLSSAQAEQTRLQSETAKYADIPATQARLTAAKAQYVLAMGSEVRWSYYLNDVSLRIPAKVNLTRLEIKQTIDAPTPGKPTVAATTPEGIATVTIEGKGEGHNDVAAWLDAIGKLKGFTYPYATRSELKTNKTGDVVEFDSTVVVTSDALSQRAATEVER